MTKTLAPSVTTRDQKGLKFVSIVEAAYNKARLSEEEAQRVNDTPGLAEVVGGFIATNRRINQFVNEEVVSTWNYPGEYRLRSLEEQAEVLHSLGLLLKPVGASQMVDGAEGLFLIPSPLDIVPAGTPDPYNYALGMVLERLGKRSFHNYRNGQTGASHLRWAERSSRMFLEHAKTQDGHTPAFPGQFGFRHRGRSVRRAREVFLPHEFGAGPYEVGVMALTHPDRFVRWEQLHVDCPGGEWSLDADGVFANAPIFYFNGDKLKFGAKRVSDADGNYGSVSLFLPQ